MVEQQEVTHLCGHARTVMYARGASAREAGLDREKAARTVCAKCEDKCGEKRGARA